MDSDQKLNKLINEYKMENEKTSAKISDLKDKLVQSQHRTKGKSPGKSYSKSFKAYAAGEYFNADERSPQSSPGKKTRGSDPYKYQGSALRWRFVA